MSVAGRAAGEAPAADHETLVPTADRWAIDARRAVGIPGGVIQRTAEMSRAREALELLRARGVPATYTHLVVRATALAIARNPGAYQMVCGYDRLTTTNVDVGVTTSDAPTELPAVVTGVERIPLGELPARVGVALTEAARGGARIARGGWLGTFAFVRRWILARFHAAFPARRRLAGLIEVACSSDADVFAPIRFHTDAVVGAGRVRDVVVVRDGVPAIRPMMHMSLGIDHVAMDGMRAAALINAVKEILEGDELLAEARDAVAALPPGR